MLEPEISRLMKLIAERALEIKVMKDIVAQNGERAGLPETHPFRNGKRGEGRQRRACVLMQAGRSCMEHKAKLASENAPVIKATAGSVRLVSVIRIALHPRDAGP